MEMEDHHTIDFDELIRKFEDDYYGTSNGIEGTGASPEHGYWSDNRAISSNAISLVIPSPVSLSDTLRDQSICAETHTNDLRNDSSISVNLLSRSKHILEKKSFLTLVKADGTCTTSYPLSTTCCTIGSHSCDIQIELPSVSPEHARIILDENNDAWLEPIATDILRNGEYVDTRIQLFDLDEIEIGGRKFRYTCSFGKRNHFPNGSNLPSTPSPGYGKLVFHQGLIPGTGSKTLLFNPSISDDIKSLSSPFDEGLMLRKFHRQATNAQHTIHGNMDSERSSSENLHSPLLLNLLDSPEAFSASSSYRSRVNYNRTVYTPSMQMTADEVNSKRQLELASLVENFPTRADLHMDAAASPPLSDQPTEVSFLPFPSTKGGGRAAYNRTVFSPSMGVTAEELAAMRQARSRHVIIKSPNTGDASDFEVLETRPAAAPVPSFRALYNRVIHSPSMGVTQEELEALQLAAQMGGDSDNAPEHTPSFGIVPVARFRSLYRKVALGASDILHDESAAAEISALKVAACFPDDCDTLRGEEYDSNENDGEDASDFEWHVGVVPMSTFAGGTPFPPADRQLCSSAEGSTPGSCTTEMLMRWAVSGQNLFTGAGEGASTSPLSASQLHRTQQGSLHAVEVVGSSAAAAERRDQATSIIKLQAELAGAQQRIATLEKGLRSVLECLQLPSNAFARLLSPLFGSDLKEALEKARQILARSAPALEPAPTQPASSGAASASQDALVHGRRMGLAGILSSLLLTISAWMQRVVYAVLA